ncbi:MAG: DoxX family membrane protein [Candidatus Glassbacteria bacterium]|nr:DoxX family membrane protein [Candidatus Glassbacteria bacterium]
MSERNVVDTGSNPVLSTVQMYGLFLLRLAVGWHFLYEGVVKLLDPGWSSAGYLAGSKWILGGLFNWILLHPAALVVVDFLNVWGLILIGLGLLFGCLTRVAGISGIALLLLYYVANPPLVELNYGMYAEGNYLIVDKNLVELFALFVLVFFHTDRVWGIDRLMRVWQTKPGRQAQETAGRDPAGEAEPGLLLKRREILKNLVGLPLFGGFVWAVLRKRGWESYEERHLLAAAGEKTDAVTSATIKTFQFASLKDLKGRIPYGYIGDLKLSRMILGGNLIGGWAHARDLIYVSKLVKAYHHDQKVFQTFRLAEACGVNTILTNPALCRVINEYWRKEQGKIQFISDCAFENDVIKGIKVSIDGGAHACYIQGGISDRLVPEGKLDVIGEGLELIRRNGLPAGIGAHALSTVKECVAYGLKPDYWVKTLHHVDYWSATPTDEHDNVWCTEPAETIAFMNALAEPWIAFKVLAAGAIHPGVGFPYAFKNGADFICVGMYDFQIVEDVNLASEVLAGDLERERPWRA